MRTDLQAMLTAATRNQWTCRTLPVRQMTAPQRSVCQPQGSLNLCVNTRYQWSSTF